VGVASDQKAGAGYRRNRISGQSVGDLLEPEQTIDRADRDAAVVAAGEHLGFDRWRWILIAGRQRVVRTAML